MRYLGIDVHVATSVWCLLDESGEIVRRGTVPTTAADLTELMSELRKEDELVAGQEVGKMSHFVHDVLTAAGVKLLSFNPYHLRMIASSRKKTDRRDAYWIGKALQTGMTPHPVFIPTGQVRELRSLLTQRHGLQSERRRWLERARAHLQAAGYKTRQSRSVARMVAVAVREPQQLNSELTCALELCSRMEESVVGELKLLEERLKVAASAIDDIERLTTIPGVGQLTATMIYAAIGDVSRFRNARQLAAYAGLVPSTYQSGNTTRQGSITREGSSVLRACLVQCGHCLLARCRTEEAAPLRAAAERVQARRGRRKITVVAAARHILRLAYYILRDGSVYEPRRLKSPARAAA